VLLPLLRLLSRNPIFAAIERWKELDALHGAAIHATDAIGDFESADYEAAYEAQTKACHAAWHAMEDVFKTVSTTLAGMRAKISFSVSSTSPVV
jgi:hypothetical protein